MEKDQKETVLIVEAITKNSKGEILLLKRSRKNNFFIGQWQLPGGKVEFGEKVPDAMNREFIEETGCVAEELKIDKVFSFHQEFNGFKGSLFLMVFEATCDRDIKLSEDHTKFGHFSIEKIKKMDLTPISKKSLFG